MKLWINLVSVMELGGIYSSIHFFNLTNPEARIICFFGASLLLVLWTNNLFDEMQEDRMKYFFMAFVFLLLFLFIRIDYTKENIFIYFSWFFQAVVSGFISIVFVNIFAKRFNLKKTWEIS